MNTVATNDTTLLSDALAAGALAPDPTRVLVSVAVVLALLVGVLLLLSGRSKRTSAPGGEIRLINQTSLGRKGSLVLVEVDGRRVLVGATPSHFSALSEWETLPEEHEVPHDVSESAPARFDGVLERVVTKLKLLEGVKA